jgi:pteridine reductase
MHKKPPAVLITAGTKRIGFHLAQVALGMGYSVILHYRSTNKAACLWLKKNPKLSGRVFFIQHDLGTTPEVVIEKAGALPCVLTGLINNASEFTSGNLLNHRHFERMLAIHLHAPARLGSCFASHVASGWIINISDAMIKKPNAAYQNYRMSKLFLEELTRQQAFLFAPKIRVNGIAPGAILAANGCDKKEFSAFKDKVPLQITGSPAMITDAFVFLVESEYCTGQIIAIDGGLHLN